MKTIFRKLRSKAGEVWQLDRYEIPLWNDPEEEGGEPFRPWTVVCRSVRTGRPVTFPAGRGEPGTAMFLEVIAMAARAWRLRPERIEVTGAELAADLNGFLAAEGVNVAVRDDLPELRATLEQQTRDLLDTMPPGALSVPGVTVGHVAAFARAAVRFAEAAPWRHLGPDDLLVLDSPGLPPELRCARVCGPPLYRSGIVFHPEEPDEGFAAWEREEEEADWEEDDWEGENWEGEDWQEDDWDDEIGRLEASFADTGLWKVHLGPVSDLPPDDFELWRQQDLPRAHSQAYPVAIRMRPDDGFERPAARLLAWIEAVLAALASTTPEEMDRGRWEKDVVTSEGPVALALTLPDLLEPSYVEDIQELFTPEEQAYELACEAGEALGRRRIQLARRAAELWPDCIEAWLELAHCASDRETARDLYARAVAAGDRMLLSPLADAGSQETASRNLLPCIWARTGLAEALWDLGARDEAVGHYREALALDPQDPEKVRPLLTRALLILGRHEELEELLTRDRENRADWHYTRALLTFRREGSSPAARRELAAALRASRHIARQLLGPRLEPGEFSRFGWGDEPASYPFFFQDVWRDTPGALEWLRTQNALAVPGPARGGKRKEKRKKKKRPGRRGR